MYRVVLLVLLVLSLSACSGIAVQVAPTPTPTAIPTAEPCAIQAAPFLAEVDPILAAWADTVTLADHTGRASLAPVISQLQALRRDVSQLEPPDCAASAHALLVTSMDETINGYLAFMAQESDREVSTHIAAAGVALEAASDALYEVRTGEPAPTRTPRPTATVPPLIAARNEATHIVAATGLTVMDSKIVRTWMGQTLAVRVQGLSPDADVATLRPAMEASVGILRDHGLAAFALHIADDEGAVVRTVGARRLDVISYSDKSTTFEDFAAQWEYR
jgi:hypothetical protein